MNTLVVGIGNELLSDEAIGLHVVRWLEKTPLPPKVELVEAGTPGLDLAFLFVGRQKVVVVDAVDAEASPGTIFRIPIEELKQNGSGISAHDFGLVEAWRLAEVLGPRPEVVVIGAVPKSLEPGMGLSPELREVLPKIAEAVQRECGWSGSENQAV